MSIKLTLLRSGESLIAETKELISQEDQLVPHSYLVENPHIVHVSQQQVREESGDFKLDIMLSPWMVLSADKTMVIPIDWVVTIVEPLDSVKKLYLDKKESFKIREEETNGD
mgnify:CR=1 FL=1|tara:strand:+ start:178 stop:513 length:336 start_codon:yes stop_codon:yes gene_type:complete